MWQESLAIIDHVIHSRLIIVLTLIVANLILITTTSFTLGLLFLLLPNVLSALWGLYIVTKKKQISANSLTNTYLLKLSLVGFMSYLVSSITIEWPSFLTGLLAALAVIVSSPLLIWDTRYDV
jgi:hypothetical protein